MRSILTSILFSIVVLASAQNAKIDSLSSLVEREKNDSTKESLRCLLANEYLAVDVEKSIALCELSLKSSLKAGWDETSSLAYNVIGIANKRKGNYAVAVEYYLKSLKLSEKLGDKKGEANVYNNMGEIYRLQKNMDLALKYHLKALEIRKEVGVPFGIAASLNNLALVYDMKGDFKKAEQMHADALLIRKEIGDASGMATSLGNIGNFYFSHEDYKKALDFYERSLHIIDSIGDKSNVPLSLLNIGSCYFMKKDYKRSETFFLKALEVAKANLDKNWMTTCYEALGELYNTTGDYKKAYQNNVESSALKDSLFNADNAKQIAQMNALYETEKKDNEIKQLNAEKKAQTEIGEANDKRNSVIIWSVAGGFVLVMVFASVLFRALRTTKKQKAIIQTQKEMVEDKQQAVMDSIHYAKRIQQSLLPTEKYIDKNLNRLIGKR